MDDFLCWCLARMLAPRQLVVVRDAVAGSRPCLYDPLTGARRNRADQNRLARRDTGRRGGSAPRRCGRRPRGGRFTRWSRSETKESFLKKDDVVQIICEVLERPNKVHREERSRSTNQK